MPWVMVVEMVDCKFFVKLLSGAAFGFLLGQPSARAEGYQIGQDVRTFRSQYDLGQYHLWECDSSISYIDAANSQVFYCERHPPRSHHRRQSLRSIAQCGMHPHI
jgi:hypothetical protein